MSQMNLLGIEPVSTEPAFCWPGGKRRLMGEILPLLPDSGPPYLISPFVGGGAVELAAAGMGRRVAAYDANPDLVRLWDVMLNRPHVIAEHMSEAAGYSKEEMREAMLFEGKDDDARAAALFFRLQCCLYGTPKGRTLLLDWPKTLSPECQARVRRFRAPGLTVKHADYRQVMTTHRFAPAYLDPPYVDERGMDYEDLYPGVPAFDHDEFARVVKGHKGMWLLSINDCAWSRDTFSDCEITTLALRWQIGARAGSKTQKRGELLIRPKG